MKFDGESMYLDVSPECFLCGRKFEMGNSDFSFETKMNSHGDYEIRYSCDKCVEFTKTFGNPKNLYKTVVGMFNPQVTTDLQANSEKIIGKTFIWMYSWIIEDGDYKGQYAMTIRDRDNTLFKDVPFAWAPECDVWITCCLQKMKEEDKN